MSDVLPFPPQFRVIDCQGEGRAMSQFKASVQMLNPGIDLTELMILQDKERRKRRHKENMQEWMDLTKRVCREATDDPLPHMDLFIRDLQGRSSDQ